jgi:4-hydroxybenzoate polyprenyltransferase
MSLSTLGVVHEVVNPFWLPKRFTEKLSDIYDLLVFSSALLGLAGVGMVYTSSFIQGISCPLPALAIGFLVPFAVYNLNRKTDHHEDAVNHQNRYSFTTRFDVPLSALSLVAYGAAYLIVFPYGNLSIFVVSIPLIAGALYSLRWIPPPLPFRRLKEIPVVKNFIVAGTWSSVSALLPVSILHGLPGPKTWICIIFFFSYVITSSTIPDIRDRDGDALAGVRTIPVILGAENTQRLLVVLNILVGAFAIAGGFSFMAFIVLLTIGISIMYTHCCIRIFDQFMAQDFICDFLIDGQFVLFGMAIFTLSSLQIFP